MPFYYLILCHLLLLLAFNLSQHQVFSKESILCIRWPKYWNFSPSNEYSRLISLRNDWFDFLAVQGTLQESFPTSQFKNINSSVLSFLYAPTCTPIHDYWKSHSFDYDLIIAFEQSLLLSLLCHLVIETALYPHVPKVKGRDMRATLLNAMGIWSLYLLNLHLPLHSPLLSPSII